MHTKTILSTLLVSAALSSALPQPGVNQPISDEEMKALEDGGLKTRQATVNQPISDDEMKALHDAGLKGRSTLEARDKLMNCGRRFKGKGDPNGHGKWIPVTKYYEVVETFCGAYVGTDIALNHETSDTYPISLTNEDDHSQPGEPGNIVFAIYNTEHEGTWVVDKETCLRGMKAPLGDGSTKRDEGVEYVNIGKRDICYRKKHFDYHGGYFKISGIGAFGAEVGPA